MNKFMDERRKAFAKMLPIIKAYSEGKEIEFKNKYDTEWSTADLPNWKISTEYRVKPEPEIYYTRVFRNFQTGTVSKIKIRDEPSTLIGFYKTTVIDGTIVDVCFEPLEKE